MLQILNQLSFNLLIVRIGRSDKKDLPFTLILQANRNAAYLLGFSEQELINRPLTLIFASDREMTALQSAVEKADNLTADNCFEGEIITKNKHKIHVLLSLSQLPEQHSEHTDYFLLIQTIDPDNDLLRMHRVVEQSASAVMITNHAGNIEYVNPKFTELTGYSKDELLGQNPRMFQAGNMSQVDYQLFWQDLLDKGEWRGEFLNQRKDGSTYWVLENISAIKNSTGEITHFVAVEEDITRRKDAESALAESEQRFRQMAEMTGEWLWEQDPNGYYLYSSAAVKQILGYSPDQVIGKNYTELLTAQDQATQQTYAFSQRPFIALINHYQHREGQQVLTESTGLPILNAKGEIVKWRGVDHDITARMHFQEALIESEKRTRLIIESSMNAIVIMDSYGIIIDWNRRAEKMFGWSREEAVGQRLDDLIIPPRFHIAHREGLRAFLQTGVGPMLNKLTETAAIRRDGTEFPVELSVSPLKLGNAYVFSGFIHDISSRKAAEEQIRQAQVNLAITQNEIRIAQQIQATLSPSVPITTPELEVTGTCLPADKVGGDYFDYFFRNETELEMVIADVSGHSIGPALFMVEARSAIRAQTDASATPADTLQALNNFLFADLNQSDYFITLFYAQIDVGKRQMRYANAGHPPPLLLNRRKKEFKELDAEGLLLGIRKNIIFEEKTIDLESGDLILFYTDGLTEAENADKNFFGLQRTKDLLLQHADDSPQDIIKTVFTELGGFCQNTAFADDVTLMVLRYH